MEKFLQSSTFEINRILNTLQLLEWHALRQLLESLSWCLEARALTSGRRALVGKDRTLPSPYQSGTFTRPCYSISSDLRPRISQRGFELLFRNLESSTRNTFQMFHTGGSNFSPISRWGVELFSYNLATGASNFHSQVSYHLTLGNRTSDPRYRSWSSETPS